MTLKRNSIRTPDIVEFVTDPQLLGLTISEAQETLLRAIYGLPLSQAMQEMFFACTGRQDSAGHGFGETTVLAGARAGKDSRIAAPIVCFEAIFGDHEKNLAKGERATIPLVAQDKRATNVAFVYIRDYLTSSKLLESMVDEVLSLEIQLTNRVRITCFPSTQRSLRGWSIPAAVMDEVAFFRLEGAADSDTEIQASIRRGMISFPAPRLVKISTPYMRSGILYEDFKNYYGQDSDDVLVWRAPSMFMNPTLKESRLDRERRLDPQRFAREYEAEFAEDIDAFLPNAWVEQAIQVGCYERPPVNSLHSAAVDSSGGGNCSFTVSIVHVDGQGPERIVCQDVMRGWKKARNQTIDLEGVVGEIAEICRRYHVTEIVGDRYAAGWVSQAFERAGINYRSSHDKSQAYIDIEPLFATGRVQILDNQTLIRELKLLERRPRPGGKIQVDKPRGAFDDYANAFALAAAKAWANSSGTRTIWAAGRSAVADDPDSPWRISPRRGTISDW